MIVSLKCPEPKLFGKRMLAGWRLVGCSFYSPLRTHIYYFWRTTYLWTRMCSNDPPSVIRTTNVTNSPSFHGGHVDSLCLCTLQMIKSKVLQLCLHHVTSHSIVVTW